MSFLAGRLAGKEAAYFFEESKHAVSRMVEKNPKFKTPKTPNPNSNSISSESQEADILPEILRHSLPPKIFRSEQISESSLPNSGKWAIRNSSNAPHSVSPDVLNPLRGYLSLPQVTFGPKRWELPTSESSVTASTANELRLERHTPINPEKARAAAEGFAQSVLIIYFLLSLVGKAFAVATAFLFGTAALALGFATSKLDLHTSDDIRTKGRELVRPKFETIKEQLAPMRDWAENTSKKWHLKSEQDIKEKPMIKELSKMLRTKDSA
ncbi:hypothetical protein RDABS01_032733 [Bienertia sinuspersici]